MDIIQERARKLNQAALKVGPIIYWLSRDQRVKYNWALLAAQQLALAYKQPLVVVFNLHSSFLGATERQYQFMLTGLKELEVSLKQKNIAFQIVLCDDLSALINLAKNISAGAMITDFSPLKINRAWKKTVAQQLDCPLFEVDAHNIVPAWLVSDKQEFAAYTFRPKIKRLLDKYLISFPTLKKHPYPYLFQIRNDYQAIENNLTIDRQVKMVSGFKSGEKAAYQAARNFIKNRLPYYNEQRNNPNLSAQSDLSPYLHFGQLSAQGLALMIQASDAPLTDKEAFLEELIVRRELADNFCLYNENYDNQKSLPQWAQLTLKKHASDKREYVYSKQEFELAHTHDKLWNAAQLEMIKTGKMHGYMRMYWAKKILEWTKDVETAFKIAIYLNDKYELDGRDPNGYAGIAWSLGGVHDRAWSERAVFGKIRYMNENGCRRKFDVDAYIQKHL
jgi:deoxyribodipyrimidine photo-lyase